MYQALVQCCNLCVSLQRRTLIFNGTLSMTLCTNVPRTHIVENCQTVCYYDPDLPVSLETDTSQVWSQCCVIISFMSKALTDTQSRYSNIECEILGMVTGVGHFHQYLFGRQFTLYTGHKPIENLVLKPLVDTSPRVQRLMLHLSQYNINMQYKAGKYLLLSDCLSRLSISCNTRRG